MHSVTDDNFHEKQSDPHLGRFFTKLSSQNLELKLKLRLGINGF